MGLTLEDIGRLAGVSRSTVSRVVNGDARVRPEVRARVQEIISETGYTPHLAARSLVSNRSGVVGLVIPSGVHRLFDDPYFAELIAGITASSNEAGVVLTLFLLHTEDEERALYPRIVDTGFLDGVLVTATRMDDPLVGRLVGHDLPLVMIGRPDRSGVSYVDVDNRGGAALAARHLVDCGHRRIGTISAPANTTTGRERLDGLVDELARLGRPLDPALCVDGGYSEDGAYRAMRTLVDRGADAVFAASDTMAFGALRAAADLGVDVPGDVGLVGFDGFDVERPGRRELTTIRQPVQANAERAVAMLLGQIADRRAGRAHPMGEILPVALVPGSTTRARAPIPCSPPVARRVSDPSHTVEPSHQMESPS